MKYFKRQEFACKCGCGFDTVDYELAIVLDSLRNNFNTPVIINSGCRCKEHNKEIGGSPKSQHLVGKAADIVVKGIHENMVYAYLDEKYPNKYGLGLYEGRVHIDVRPNKTRWKG